MLDSLWCWHVFRNCWRRSLWSWSYQRQWGAEGGGYSAVLLKPVRSQHVSSIAVVATDRARSRAAWCAFDLSHYGKQFSPFSLRRWRSKLCAFSSTVRQRKALKSQRQNMPTRIATALKISAVMILPISTHTATWWQSYKAGFWHTAAPWRWFPMAFKPQNNSAPSLC